MRVVQEPTLSEITTVLKRRWAPIVMTSVGLAVVMGLLSYAIPPQFQASTTLLPAPSSDRLPSLASLAAGIRDLGLPVAASMAPAVTYPEIVMSRRLLEGVLHSKVFVDATGDSVPLIDVIQPQGAEPKRNERALRRMRGLVNTRLDRRTGLVTIEVKSRYPEVASQVASALASQLQQFTIESATSLAGQRRKFIEERLEVTGSDLKAREDELRGFREKNLRIGNSPRLQIEEGRLARALREQEEVYLTLRREYEMTKIEEHRDVASIVVLDPAVPPVFRHSPSRVGMAILGLIAGGLVGSIVVVAGRPNMA